MTDVNTIVENRNSNAVIEGLNHDALEVVNDLEHPVLMGGETSDLTKIRKFSKQNNTSLALLFSIGKELSGSRAGGRIVSLSLSN